MKYALSIPEPYSSLMVHQNHLQSFFHRNQWAPPQGSVGLWEVLDLELTFLRSSTGDTDAGGEGPNLENYWHKT